MTTSTEPQVDVNRVNMTRTFSAPRALVWRAWTDPELYKQWWGPAHFTCPYARIDLRVGGQWLSCMRSPDGQDYWSTGFYREIVLHERIVATDSFADAQGNIVPATHYGMAGDFPLEMLVTVTFAEQEGKTVMTLVHSGLPAGDGNTEQGWRQSFDKLAAAVEKP
jgi:uncharacterized protein YndB with AHSA1/START domain